MLGTTNVLASMNTLSISINGTNKLSYNGENNASLDISLSSLGAAASNHNHDSVYAKLSHTHNYLPLSGGTMTGALNLKNNTWNLAGDDVFYGDANIAGCFCIKGVNSTTGLAFVKREDITIRQILRSDGNTLSIEKDVKVANALYESNDRVITKRVAPSPENINQFNRFFTIYPHIVDSTSGVSGLESVPQHGMCMTVDGVGTPFQIWVPDTRMLIAKKIKSSTAFNILQFCRMQSGAPDIDILWCW